MKQAAHEYRIGEAITKAHERYGDEWFRKVTIVYIKDRGYLIEIGRGPRGR